MTTDATSMDSPGTARAVYILYLVGIVVPILSIVAVVMAYVNQGKSSPWLATHYRFQIRTFWMGLLYSVIAITTMFAMVGYALALFVLVWLVVRCVKGMQALEAQQAPAYPESWMFG